MKRKMHCYMLIALLAIIMAGCNGDIMDSISGGDEVIAGADWRTYRGYSYGAIHDDPDLDVLYFLYDDGDLAFFLDDSSQTLVLTVPLEGQPDPDFCMENLFFADKNDDEYQDLCVPLERGGLLIWLWNVEGNCFYDDPCSPQGLWLTMKDWPEDAVYRSGEENDQGVAAYTWEIPGGPAFVLERTQPLEGDAEELAAEIAASAGIDSAAITLEGDADLTESLTYPAYRLEYTEEAETPYRSTDIYVRTDRWDFRVHTVIAADAPEDVRQNVEGWLQSLVFQEFPSPEGEADEEDAVASEESSDLTDEEISAMALELAQEGGRVFWWYYDFENEDLEIDQEAPAVEEYFHPVGKFGTVDEMKAASEIVFTERFCREVLYPVGFESESGNLPHFKEIDGVLHSNSNAGGMGWIYGLTDQAEVKSREENRAVVTIIGVDPDGAEEPFDFTLVLEDGVWRLDNWFSFGTEDME